MEIPDYSQLNEMNRVLFAISELSHESEGCSVANVIQLCSSVTYSGRPFDHRKSLNIFAYAGLIERRGSQITLTDLGLEAISLNKAQTYELNDSQRQFIAQRLILDGPWRSRSRNLLHNFSPNYREMTYEYAAAQNPFPRNLERTAYLLRRLSVLRVDGTTIKVSPDYVVLVKELRADGRNLSEDDLAEKLQENLKLGSQAEEAVLEYERRRLSELGRLPEAGLVRRISQLDTTKGYDIESYDGDKPLFDYDRFIEVKSSHQKDLRFYWTANEYAVAKKLGAKYWIYFVGNFNPNKSGEINPVKIQDPATALWQMPEITVDVSVYLIRPY